MSYDAVMSMPVRAFWHFSHSIDRIRAEEDQRQFRVMNNAQGGENTQAYLESLDATVGKVFVVDTKQMVLTAKPEEGAFDSLRQLAAM